MGAMRATRVSDWQLTSSHSLFPTAAPPQEAHQLCDIGLVLSRAIGDRLRGGKPAAEPPRFPGTVTLPRICFRYVQQQQQSER